MRPQWRMTDCCFSNKRLSIHQNIRLLSILDVSLTDQSCRRPRRLLWPIEVFKSLPVRSVRSGTSGQDSIWSPIFCTTFRKGWHRGKPQNLAHVVFGPRWNIVSQMDKRFRSHGIFYKLRLCAHFRVLTRYWSQPKRYVKCGPSRSHALVVFKCD